MQIKHGVISADSHVVLDRDAFGSRMSLDRWGERIPHVIETKQGERAVERWMVNANPPSGFGDRGVTNCPALIPDGKFPQRWEEVPREAYVPHDRLEVLDQDGVDAEVLFPNDPGTFFQYKDADFELACVAAYNDALAGWGRASDRFVPLTMVPILGSIESTVAEVERATAQGHHGINFVAEPGTIVPGLKHISDPHWYPLWDACQTLGVPVHFHENARIGMNYPLWSGLAARERFCVMTCAPPAHPVQFMANLIFSGITERFPTLQWVFAETGAGSMPYALQACDNEWERRHLWTEGLKTRPSDVFRRSMHVNFWFERGGVLARHEIGVDRFMWMSDFPHMTTTYPNSRANNQRMLAGVPEAEQQQMLWKNAAELYGLA